MLRCGRIPLDGNLKLCRSRVMKRYDILIGLLCLAWLLALTVVATGPSGGVVQFLTNSATAAWAQAVGVFVAIVGSVWISRRDQQHRVETRRREELDRARNLVIHARRLALDVLGTLPGDRMDPVQEERRWARVRVKWEVIEADLRRIDLVNSRQYRAQLSINGRFAEILALRDQAATAAFSEADIGVLEEAIIALDGESRKVLDQHAELLTDAMRAGIEQLRTIDRCRTLANMFDITATRLESRRAEFNVAEDWVEAMLTLAQRRRGLAEQLRKRPLTDKAHEVANGAIRSAWQLDRLLRRLKSNSRVGPETEAIERILVQLRWTSRQLRRLHAPHGFPA